MSVPDAGRRTRARRPPAETGTAARVAAVAYVALGLVLTTALAWPLYDTPRLAVVTGVAGAVGIAIAVVARLRRWAWWGSALAVAAAYVVLVVPLAVPGALRSPLAILTGLRDGIAGIVQGWKQILTLDTPLGEYQGVLVPVFAIALIGGALATALALRPDRRGALAVPVVLAGGVFGVAFAATSAGPPARPLWLTIPAPREVLLGTLLVGLSLAWLIVRAGLARRAAIAVATSTTVRSGRTRGGGASLRRRLLGAGLLAGALVIGLLAVPVFAGATERTTLRTGVEPLLVLRDVTTPLGGYRASFAGDAIAAPLFSVAGDVDGLDRIGIATLDSWDGRQFAVSADDTRFTRLPGGTAPAGAQTVDIVIESGFRGIWMPMPSGVRSAPQFTGPRADDLADGFFVDRASGAAVEIAGDGVERGLRTGDGYRVDAVPAATAPLGEPSASAGIDLAAYPQLASWVDAQDQPRTAGGLAELLERLRERGYLSHALEEDSAAAEWIASLSARAPYVFQSSYAGHSASRIEALFQQLTDQEQRVGADAAGDLLVAGVGDDEQFAAAGALVARALGFDSRVVVGVRLADLPGSGVPACDGTCTGGDLAAWIEVRAPGDATWSTFDVEPQFARSPAIVRVGQELPQHPTAPEQPRSDSVQPPSTQRDDGESGPAPEDDAAEWIVGVLAVLRVALLVGTAVLLVLLPLLVLLVAKAVRRRSRRRAPAAEAAIVGAWEEVLDRWTDAGVRAPGRTRRERATAAGSESAVRLAGVVDGAVFAAAPPSPAAVHLAWELADACRIEATARSGRWRRLWAAVSPASFLARVTRRHPAGRAASRKEAVS